jgi:hypothetical protein
MIYPGLDYKDDIFAEYDAVHYLLTFQQLAKQIAC